MPRARMLRLALDWLSAVDMKRAGMSSFASLACCRSYGLPAAMFLSDFLIFTL